MPRIAIVGGGPAGSSFALNLLCEGIDPRDIVIFDQAEFPRPKLCGGAITYRGTQALGHLIGEPSERAKTVRLDFRSRLGRYEVREPGSQWLYDRAYLDHRLIDRCIERRIEVRQKARVLNVTPGGRGFRVEVRGHAAESFDWVIGADGASGVTRRAAGLRGGGKGRLVEGVFEPISADVDSECLYFDFDPVLDGIPGYAWIFPYPKPGARGLFKIGIMDGRGRVPGAVLRKWTEDFAMRHGFRAVDAKVGGWPEHYYDAESQAHRPGLVLIGEAHGIDPLLGEGIAPSFEMAGYAARRLKEALDGGSRSIRGYEAGFRRTDEGKNLWLQGVLANRIYGRHPERWMRVMFGVPYLHRLAASGEEMYGRLNRNLGKMVAAITWHMMLDGVLASSR